MRISECQHPGARRPLRLLSSFFYPTHQNHITILFVEFVVATLNGQKVDWPEEFYHEITEEILTLHHKHLTPKVKVEKTSIGPHVIVILKAAKVLDIIKQLEVGYRSQKGLTLEEQIPHPKMKKPKGAKELQPTATNCDPAPQSDQSPVTQVYKVTPQATTPSEASKTEIILESSEFWQPPSPLSTMVDQIFQVHRKLENLLTPFTTKAPQNWWRG